MKKLTRAFSAFSLGLLFSAVLIQASDRGSEPARTVASDRSNPDASLVTEESFEKKVLKEKLPVLVDFSADWCMPCQMMHPRVEQIAKEFKGKMKVYFGNVDYMRKISQTYQIENIPTLLIFKDGKVIARKQGAAPKDDPNAIEKLRAFVNGAIQSKQ